MHQEEIPQTHDDIFCPDLPAHLGCQAFPALLVQDGENLQGSAITGPAGHQITAPDVILPLRPKSNTGTVIEPQPSPCGLFPGHFQSFLSPDSLYTLMVHLPSHVVQESPYASVTVPAVLAGKLSNPGCQCLPLSCGPGAQPLCGSRLIECSTRPTLRCM